MVSLVLEAFRCIPTLPLRHERLDRCKPSNWPSQLVNSAYVVRLVAPRLLPHLFIWVHILTYHLVSLRILALRAALLTHRPPKR